MSDTPDSRRDDDASAHADSSPPDAPGSPKADASGADASGADASAGARAEKAEKKDASSARSDARPPSKKSSGSKSSGSKSVPPEKAPSKRASKKKGGQKTGTKDGKKDGRSPASGLKGLQKGEEDTRRGLLARSKRLQNMLTSNRPLGVRNLLWATLAVLAVIAGLLAATGRIGTVTRSIANSFRSEPAPAGDETLEKVASESDDGVFTFAQLSRNPDKMLQPYFGGTVAGAGGDAKSRADLVQQFRSFTKRYLNRYGVDDNFTMRISDARTDSLLEVFTLEKERKKYEDAGEPAGYNWGRIDALRRQETDRLVDKWVARGIPQDPIRVKWGMASKTREARRRDLPFIEYEIRLSRLFGKSLLMTAVGTKETFNQDELVSSVNAKSRYQLMPSLLSAFGIHRYRLPTQAGNNVLVAEEQHPLLTMEPAFEYLTASINAMGNELSGISAYHTGVNNIYNEIYVKFLKNAQPYISPGVTTADAYIWGVTEGFPTVTHNSSFGNFSRSYVVGAYAALKAMEDATIDTSDTMIADRVQLKSGQSITLDDLLTTLADHGGGALPWKSPDSLSLYQRFRTMNKHFHLPGGPPAGGDSVTVGVPARGNVKITATSGGDPVRFFLPPGARHILKKNGRAGLIDESKVFQFNHDTYPDPNQGILTKADRQYRQLIDEIRRFGFTSKNRQELKRLDILFNQLASSEPTHYRKLMSDVIDQHRQFWRYPGWEKVKNTAQAVLGRNPAQPQQPQPLPTQPLQTPRSIDSDAKAGR